MDIKSLAHQERTVPHLGELYAEYLRAIRDEEARLGRQLTPSEAERINAEVMAPLNQAAWSGSQRS